MIYSIECLNEYQLRIVSDEYDKNYFTKLTIIKSNKTIKNTLYCCIHIRERIYTTILDIHKIYYDPKCFIDKKIHNMQSHKLIKSFINDLNTNYNIKYTKIHITNNAYFVSLLNEYVNLYYKNKITLFSFYIIRDFIYYKIYDDKYNITEFIKKYYSTPTSQSFKN
jgi:wyosine [tRNA(Phe)-imidazoG37] synthetase (radical SAM superfamily)